MNVVLLLSGGAGTRLGSSIPKQYVEIEGKPMIAYCMETIFSHPFIDWVQIVADIAWRDRISEWITRFAGENAGKLHGFSAPGESRQLSILNGLTDIFAYADDSDYVFIHDAARPLLSEKQTSDCLRAAQGHDGAIPVLRMKDTVYLSADGKRISGLLKRNEVYAGQAPEVFRFGRYYEATRKLLPNRILQVNGSTEPAVLAGMDIVMLPGEEMNFKITTKSDMELFRKIIQEKGLRQ